MTAKPCGQADVILDHQYLHVDPERASKTLLGDTIAHGFLYLSLIPHLILDNLLEQIGQVTILNYGVNRLRFIAPVRAGAAFASIGSCCRSRRKRKPDC
tara:strand:+ start:20307 stop:20603 length:297 start_codon:yes stop_codon:yes gene_type:complete